MNKCNTTATSSKETKTNNLKKKILLGKDRPDNYLDGIMYDLEYLHKIIHKNTNMEKKPGYQNHPEV